MCRARLFLSRREAGNTKKKKKEKKEEKEKIRGRPHLLSAVTALDLQLSSFSAA